MTNRLIVGASRGLGAALAQGLHKEGDETITVSRTKPNFSNHRWIQADLSMAALAVDDIVADIGTLPLDVLVYNAGISESREFIRSRDEESIKVLNVNLVTPVLLVKRLMPNLLEADAPIVFLIGSTCGLPNEGTTSVAYATSKFGLRGLGQSLREVGRSAGVRVSCISVGSMASDVDFVRGADLALRRHQGKRIPVADMVQLIDCLTSLSPASCVKEVIMPATLDTDA